MTFLRFSNARYYNAKDGWFDLYKELQKVDLDVKVCFLTASEKYREGLREGEYQTLSKDLFIQKPLSIKDLTKKIHKRIGSN